MRMDYKGLTTEEADGIRKQVAQARYEGERICLVCCRERRCREKSYNTIYCAGFKRRRP